MLKRIQYCLAGMMLICASLNAEDTGYKLGHGMQLGTLPLYVGGYFSVEYEDNFDQYRSLRLDDISMMLYGEQDNISYMAEFEAMNVYSEVFGNEAADAQNEHFHIERLYLDYSFNDTYTLRVGKYNSLIGIWNRIPINVLRDTSSNPRIATTLFPQFTSGLDIAYSTNNSNDLHFDLMMQETEDMDNWISKEIYNNFETDRHYGLGASFSSNEVLYHVNAGYFHTVEDHDYYYLSAAFEYHYESLKLQAEFGSQFDNDMATLPYIGYIQGLYSIKEEHEAIVRVESYSDKETQTKDTFAVFGYTYRPLYPIAIKGEYQWHSLHREDQLLFSFSVLF